MAHATRFVAAVAVLTALAVGVPVQAQTPEIDVLRVRFVPFAGEALNVGSGKLEQQIDSETQAMSNSPIMSAPITGADE